jgi:hypothetical protein
MKRKQYLHVLEPTSSLLTLIIMAFVYFNKPIQSYKKRACINNRIAVVANTAVSKLNRQRLIACQLVLFRCSKYPAEKMI